MRFGRKPKVTAYDTLQLRHYTAALGLPPPPAATTNLARMLTDLKATEADVPTLFPMDDNDTLGNCTIVAVAHAETGWKSFLKQRYVMPVTTVDGIYNALTGGQDTGLDELTVLNHWRHASMGPDQILGFVAVQPHNHVHVQQAIATFGGLYIGFQCTADIETQFDAGQPWTPAPLTQDGHAVYVYDYDATGVACFTWGATQKGTWAWWDECVDEAYVILPPEAKTSGFIPGISLATLTRDMQLVR